MSWKSLPNKLIIIIISLLVWYVNYDCFSERREDKNEVVGDEFKSVLWTLFPMIWHIFNDFCLIILIFRSLASCSGILKIKNKK